jgi:hypothetical protein
MEGTASTGRLACLAGLAVFAAWTPAMARPANTLRTSWGAPDLGGTWSNLSLTPLERPADARALILTDADAADLEASLTERRHHPPGDAVGQRESEFWPEAHLARIDGKARSSWLTSPADGKLPYTAEGRQRLSARFKADFDNPESRPEVERCLTGGAAGPPLIPPNYNANYKIVQTRHDVIILSEMNDELRIIRLDSGHQPTTMGRWTGDSIGHFEGDTLVVETIGFRTADTASPTAVLTTADTKVTERFTRASSGELRYRFTVEEPGVYSSLGPARWRFAPRGTRSMSSPATRATIPWKPSWRARARRMLTGKIPIRQPPLPVRAEGWRALARAPRALRRRCRMAS